MKIKEIPHNSSSPQASRHAKSWAATQLNVTKYSFVWTIHNFSWIAQTGRRLESPTFPTDDSSENLWQLRFFPKGNTIENRHYLSLYLKSVICSKYTEVEMHCEFSIQNASKDKTCISRGTKSGLINGQVWGFGRFLRRSRLIRNNEDLLPGGKLTLCCEVNVFGDLIHVSGQQNRIQEPDCKAFANFCKLFECQKVTDVILVSGDGHELSAHRAILAAQSPVFSSMFEIGMAESISGRVELPDVEHEVMKEVLRFIYTGNVFDMDKRTDDLLIAADKYALDRLKVMCEYQLFKSLCVSNAVESLILADTHSAEQLKAGVLDFIGSHAIDVMDTDAWQELNKNHPSLISEVLRSLAIQVYPLFGPPLKKQKQ